MNIANLVKPFEVRFFHQRITWDLVLLFLSSSEKNLQNKNEFAIKISTFSFQAVKNKEIDMKGAAELLGVSYGTLYGRYRESFGYLKHAWNVTGRPQKKTNLW